MLLDCPLRHTAASLTDLSSQGVDSSMTECQAHAICQKAVSAFLMKTTTMHKDRLFLEFPQVFCAHRSEISQSGQSYWVAWREKAHSGCGLELISPVH